MFAKTIIDSDAFLDMPVSTQNLYFHLAMRADDDGFINGPRKVQRMVNSTDDDMRILLSKRFLISFETGVIVIKHWRMHNYLRSDRYKPTVYQHEMKQLSIKGNGAYTLNHGNQPATIGIPDGNQPATQVRLGKDRIGKDREREESFPPSPDQSNQPKAGKDLDRIREHWNNLPALPKYRHLIIQMPPEQTGPALRTLGTYTADEVIKAIDNYSKILGSSDHEAFPKFTGFPGFMKSGPDSYGDDAKPFDRCKIIKHEPEEDRTEREVRKAKEELAAIRARNKEAGR
jgi:hypothetical protein